jgi:predicted butyrate kinase (DUF1464 family)
MVGPGGSPSSPDIPGVAAESLGEAATKDVQTLEEKLQKINSELSHKNEELSRLNSDVKKPARKHRDRHAVPRQSAAH